MGCRPRWHRGGGAVRRGGRAPHLYPDGPVHSVVHRRQIQPAGARAHDDSCIGCGALAFAGTGQLTAGHCHTRRLRDHLDHQPVQFHGRLRRTCRRHGRVRFRHLRCGRCRSHGATPLAVWAIAFAGAVAGFLFFNFNPALVFLGDAGSISLGFLAGVFGLWGWAVGAWPFWFPFLVSAPFFLDATVTLFRRVFRGEPFWKAHREHYYQRVIRMGWTHSRTALCEYLLMAACSGLAIVMLSWPEQAQSAGLACAALVFLAVGYVVDSRWARFVEAQPHVAIAQPRVALPWRRGRHRHVVMPAPLHPSAADQASLLRRPAVVSEMPEFRAEHRQMRQGGEPPGQDS